MKRSAIILIGAAVLFGCSQNQKAIEPKEEKVSTEVSAERPTVLPTKMISLEINGMSCEMGCGSAIRKELYATNAVEDVSFDFKMGREFNGATIRFDDAKISQEKITALIEKLNDNQFTLKNVVSSNLETTVKENNAESTSSTTSYSEKTTTLSDKNVVTTLRKGIVDLLVNTILRR